MGGSDTEGKTYSRRRSQLCRGKNITGRGGLVKGPMRGSYEFVFKGDSLNHQTFAFATTERNAYAGQMHIRCCLKRKSLGDPLKKKNTKSTNTVWDSERGLCK